jgi:VanZ family protein
MSSNRRTLTFWLSAWLPVLIGLCVIATESTASFGPEYTSGPLRAIFQAIFGHVREENWEIIHHLIRKSGHFIGYGLLGLAWLRAWWMTLPTTPFRKSAALALLGTALTASADEFHQSFLPNRTSSIWDVLLDCTGAIVLMSAVYLSRRFFNRGMLMRSQ